jgi:hypothetical protein
MNFIERKYLEEGIKNITRVLQEKNVENRKSNFSELNKNLKIKLQNFIERNKLDITVENLFEKIKKDDVVASFFAKPSTKQNTSEKFVFEQIDKNVKFSISKNHPSSIKKYLIDGKITDTNATNDRAKSIDYEFKKDLEHYLVNQKYTSEYGSEQDDRYAELLEFSRSNQNTKYPMISTLIVDGGYFLRNASKYTTDKNVSNFDFLKRGKNLVMPYLLFIETRNYNHCLISFEKINKYSLEKFVSKINKYFSGYRTFKIMEDKNDIFRNGVIENTNKDLIELFFRVPDKTLSLEKLKEYIENEFKTEVKAIDFY